MSTGATVSNNELKAIEAEAKRLEEEAQYNHVGHNEEAKASDRLHRRLGILAVLLAAAAGLTSFSTVGAGTSAAFWPSVAAGILAFGVAAVSGLTTSLDPKARAAEHYRAANAYAALRNEARYFHGVECKRGKPIEDLDRALITLRDKLAKLNEQTLIVSTPAMTRAYAKIKAGDYKFEVDRGGIATNA